MNTKGLQPTRSYADVERALAEVFGVDAAAQRGWLRGRLQHFRRLGLTPEGPGKGKTISYGVEDIDKWLIALELAHLRLDPILIVAFIDRHWKRPDGHPLSADEAFARGQAQLRDLVREARQKTRPDDGVVVIVQFDAMSGKPVIGYVGARGIETLKGFLSPNDREAPRRVSMFNLSDRVRRLDRALATPPPPLPDGKAGEILKAYRRAQGWKR